MSAAPGSVDGHAAPARHGFRRWLMPGLTLAFFALALFFSVRYARTVDWHAVGRALRETPATVLVAGTVLAAASHGLYASIDLLGRLYTRHAVPALRVMRVAFVSYAFNLNMGSLLGGVGLRLRLYSRLGLDLASIAQVVSLSMLTNWLGYLLLAGGLFAFHPPPLPAGWPVGEGGLRALGLSLLAVVALYVALCAGGRRRRVRLRGWVLPLPPARLVALQLAVSSANWATMGALVWTLLRGQAPYPAVLAVLLLAAVAGVLTHVPAGLGVLEAVFLSLLGPAVGDTRVLAALLVYRALYYLGPWAIALGTYLGLERRLRQG